MVYHQYRYLIGSYSSNQIGFADRVEYSARILQAYLYHVQHAKFLTSSVNNAIVYPEVVVKFNGTWHQQLSTIGTAPA
jgi:hypothetical protein